MDSGDRFVRAGQAFEHLCRIMAQLRAPGGCPWDAEQTLASLKPYLIEEAYETIEAIERGEPREHCEELGDLLLQVVFQAEITQESGDFGAADVAVAIVDKLVRRHPHVFGDQRAEDVATALHRWEAVKAKERHPETSCLDGVPRALPGLLRALRTGEKAAAVGFDWPSVQGPLDKIEEEWQELRAVATSAGESTERIEEELGDLLFSVVNLARHLKIDPEEALRRTIDKFHTRFRHVERRLKADDRAPGQATLDEMDRLWEEAKLLEHAHAPPPSADERH